MEGVTENSYIPSNTPIWLLLVDTNRRSTVFSCQQLKVAYWEVKGQGEQAHQQSGVQKRLCTKRETDKMTELEVKKEALAEIHTSGDGFKKRK